MPKTSKQKTDTRKAALTAAALRDGWTRYSTALTDWIHGRARLVRIKEGTCRHGVYLPDGDCVQCAEGRTPMKPTPEALAHRANQQAAAQTRHPARYSPQLLDYFKDLLDGYRLILDPFAGTGERLRSVRPDAILNELEPAWGRVSGAVTGDALHLAFAGASFDAVVTSPTYGNRMADTFTDRQPDKHYRRNTYTHALGQKLHPHNSGGLQWGEKYKTFHLDAWREVYRVMKSGGRFVLNISDHIRAGKVISVTDFHLEACQMVGFEFEQRYEVKTPRNRLGQNGKARVENENILVFRKPTR